MELIFVGLAIVVVFALWFIGVSNGVNKALNKIDESKSGIEIQLTQRYDILKQSFEVAKNYAKHEESIFMNLRSINRNMSLDEINEVVDNQSQAMSSLLALGEAYPELKSAELFTTLQRQLTEENAQYSAAKRALNSNITRLNEMVITFPSSMVCSMKGVTKMPFIREDNVEQKKDIKFDWGK